MTSSARRPEETRVAVFAKAPAAGAVKTRLVPVLGETGAAALHAGLVRHALATARRSATAVELWCSPDESHPFFERCAAQFGAELLRQQGGDLGARMRHAFERALGAGSRLVLIGSDCPALTPAHLAQAHAALLDHDAALAPAEDGGYVLIGLARPLPALFEGIDWGSAAVMGQTRARLAERRVRWKELPTLWDVDRPADYERLRREGLLAEVMS
jgi:hypothetical protein